MLFNSLVAALAASSLVNAAPFFGSKVSVLQARETDNQGSDHAAAGVEFTSDVHIHESCSPSEHKYLRDGLNEMKMLAVHSYERILRMGEEDDLYVKYFGNASSAAASGFFAQIAYGNKPASVLLRCDNPDGNCNEVTAAGPWAGHHRGNNATQETVICAPTYTNRLHLSSLCWDGQEIGVVAAASWIATDLMHRMIHVPAISWNHVHHYEDSYPGVLALAASGSPNTVLNQNTFLYFAIDSYAQDVAYPPFGCVGANATFVDPNAVEPAPYVAWGTATTTAVEAAAATTAATASAADTTNAAGQTCHFHDDGTEHCF